MPLTITSDFIYSNKSIHIDAPGGVDFVQPNNPGNVHHFNQGHIIPANTRIDFNNNGGYQNIPFFHVPLGAVANMNFNNFSAPNINFLVGVDMNHNGDLFSFAPNSALNGFGGLNFGISFDPLGDMHIHEVLVPVVMGGAADHDAA